MVSLAYGGLIAYVGGTSFVVQGGYGLGPFGFSITFTTGAGSYVAGNRPAAFRPPQPLPNRRCRRRDARCRRNPASCLAGISLLPDQIAGFIGPVSVFMAGIGIMLPQGIAAAMTPFPERAGAASSLLGFLHMSMAAITLSLTTMLFGGSALVMALTLMTAGLLALAVYLATRDIEPATV